MVGGTTGNGAAIVTETKCLGAITIVGCSAANLIGLAVAFPSPLTDFVDFAGVHTLALVKDINVNGGSDGTSSISNVINTVDQRGIPAPATLVLLGAGLVGLKWFGRRRGHRA